MKELNNILGLPHTVAGVGKVYPVKILDYDNFMQGVSLLRLTKKHFDPKFREDHSLFSLSVAQSYRSNWIAPFLVSLQTLTKNWFELKIVDNDYMFVGGNGSYIDSTNYEEFRDVVFKQNLLFADRAFDDPRVKAWADKVLEARKKNAVDMSIEDKVSVVHFFTGIPFSEIAEYTVYQLDHQFQRCVMVEDYKRDIQLIAAGSDKVALKPYMEKIDLNKDPYDDVFVDKNSKLKRLNSAFNAN